MEELKMENFLQFAEEVWPEFKKTLKELVAFPSVLDEYREGADAPFGEANKQALQ